MILNGMTLVAMQINTWVGGGEGVNQSVIFWTFQRHFWTKLCIKSVEKVMSRHMGGNSTKCHMCHVLFVSSHISHSRLNVLKVGLKMVDQIHVWEKHDCKLVLRHNILTSPPYTIIFSRKLMTSHCFSTYGPRGPLEVRPSSRTAQNWQSTDFPEFIGYHFRAMQNSKRGVENPCFCVMTSRFIHRYDLAILGRRELSESTQKYKITKC